MEAGGEGAGADLREHRYVERGDGSVRPRLAVQPKALTEPVWASAPFGHSEGKAAAPEARPRSQGNPLLGRGEQPTTPARAHRERRHAPHGAAASPLEWNPRRTVSAGASLDETGGVVPTPGRGGCFSGQSPRDLLPAKRSPVPSRRTSRGRGTPRTPRQRVAKPSPRRTASPAPTSSVAEEARQADETGMAALTSIPILRGLSNSERSALSQRLGSQTFAPGEDIITQGEEGDSLFIVSSGDAEAEVRGVGVVRQYTTGQWFGELALVTNQPRKATVRAVTSCTTLRLQRTDFERLIGKLGAHMEILRRRFVSAAYSFGRKDFSKLFRHYDRDNTGFLDLAQFRTACRKDGQVKVADVDDRELRCLYHLIDLNSDGKICEADWGHFLGGDDHSAAAPAPSVPSLRFEEGVPPHGSVPSKYSSPTSSVDEPFGAADAGPARSSSMPGAPRGVMQLAASPAPGPPSDADTAEMLRSAGVGEQTVRALQSAEERSANQP